MNFSSPTPRTGPQARLAPGRFAGHRPRAAHISLLLLCAAAALAALAAGPALVGSRAAGPAAPEAGDAAPRFAAAPRALQAADTWTPLGPVAGVVVDLAASPSSPAVVYAAVDVESGDFSPTGNGAKVGDGVYKSADGGQTWAATGLTGKTIHTVAVDPANADTVYAGGFRSGVFRSRDGGQTWDGPYLPANTQEVDAFALAVHPQTTATLYVSFLGRGLHRSTDGGVTWTPVTGFQPGFFGVLRVSFDPQSPSIIYAAAGGIAVTFGVYKSTDGGQSWNRTSAGLPSNDLATEVVIDPSNTSVLYVGMGAAGTGAAGVFKSTNGGQSWAEANAGLPATVVQDLSIDPTNTSVVVAATWAGVYRTTNGGQSWAAANLAPTAVLSLARLHDNPSALLAGTRGLGVYRSSDAGATWAASGAGLPRPFVRHLAVSTTDPARLYAGTDDGLYQTADRGGSWLLPGVPTFRRSVSGLAVDPLNPSTLYAGIDFAGLFKSTNGGLSWSAILLANSNFGALAVDPSTPSTVYWAVFPTDFYKTTDGGATFGEIRTPGDAAAIAVDPTNSQIVYAGTSFTVAKSTNGGQSWASTSLRAPSPRADFIRTLTIDPNNPSTVYATVHETVAGQPAAFRTTDGGQTWLPVFQDTPTRPLVVAVQPSAPEVVYAGTESGVARSTDGGQTSQLVSNGIPKGAAVHALAFDAGGQYLYAGTSGGVFRTQVSPCSYVPLPKSQSFTAAGGANTFQVAINPACPVTAATANVDWITFTHFTDENPGGRISYAVAPNEGNRRGGVVRIRNQVFHVTQAAAPAAFAFAAAGQPAGEGDPAGAQVTITRSGDNTFPAAVTYATVDDPAPVPCDPTATQPDGTPYPRGAAYARCDYSTTIDTVFFAAGETSKTVRVPLVDDGHAEGAETFRLALSQPTNGAALGAQSSVTVAISDNDAPDAPNPIFGNRFFVRMQYLDFLSREPEVGEPWTGVLDKCPNVNNDESCDRLLVSQSFFLSPEFQLKGFFVYNFYKVAFGRLPLYVEITPDMRGVTGQTPAEVFNKRFLFTLAFVERPEFKAIYDPMDGAQYVDALAARYSLQRITTPDPHNPDGTQKVTLTLADLKTGMATGLYSRAQILRAFVQSDEVNAAEFNRAFVAMQYFGYLRRDAEPTGYQAWLTYLETHPGDYRTMVGGFVNSPEYVLRFGRR